jgi:hypothetical protein
MAIMYISRLGTPSYLSYFLHLWPACKISKCSLNVFKKADSVEYIPIKALKISVFSLRLTFCKIGLIFEFFKQITLYIFNLEHRLRGADEYDDPWEEACWGRTNIEAFNTMFKQVINLPLDRGCIDDYMDDRKGNAFLPWNLIPKNMPTSHW